jgi:Undecaprenyl-phosphate galactose phosphotransferase WbaP
MLQYEASIAYNFKQQTGDETTRTDRWPATLNVGSLILSDLLALTTAASIGYLYWAHGVLHQRLSDYLPLLPLLALFPAIYATAGLYPGFGLGAVETLRRLVHCTNASFIAVVVCIFVFKADARYSRITLGIAWLAALVFVPLLRFGTLLIVKQLRWSGEPVIIFGRLQDVARVINALRHAFALGYKVAGVVSSDQPIAMSMVEDIPVLGGMEVLGHLPHFAVRTVLLWDGVDQPSVLDTLHRHFRNVVLIREGDTLPIEHIRLRNLGGVLGIEFKGGLLGRRNAVIKRVIDIIFGTLMLIVALPIVALFGAIVQMTSPGSIFFFQEREGLHGTHFRVWKLRTMCPDAERKLAECLANDPELNRQWHRNVKLLHDPRIVPLVGNFMRRFSIDELPQLWNIVNGTMSLVGPRPFPEYHLSRFRSDFRQLRIAVRPGLTGMWQVMVRSDGGLKEQERYDTYYIRNWSLWLDIYLLARTIFVVLASSGAR